MARLLFIVLIPVLFLPGLAQPLLPVIEGLEEISHEGRVLSEILQNAFNMYFSTIRSTLSGETASLS